MKSIRQLLRQPFKTLVGIILMSAAVAVLTVCVGQSAAANKIKNDLGEIFMSIALPSAEYTEETDEWLWGYAESNPNVVKVVSAPWLASAYIPELHPDVCTNHKLLSGFINGNHRLQPLEEGNDYACAMLEVTLTSISEPSASMTTKIEPTGRYYAFESEHSGMVVNLQGTVVRAIGLAEELPDPTGFTANMRLYVADEAELEALQLEVGQRYLVYGTDYYDNDWWLRSYFAKTLTELRGILPKSFKAENLTIISEEESASRSNGLDYNNPSAIVATYQFGALTHSIPRILFNYYNIVTLSMRDDASMPLCDYALNDEGSIMEVPLEEYAYLDNEGNPVTLTAEEFEETYAEPTIVRLEGSAEEFLTSEDGELWREALENIEINGNTFPIIGVENLKYVHNFCRGITEIVEGRDFTAQELESGAKVCIISQTLADRNLLDVGDTISPQLYNSDPGLPYQVDISTGQGSVNPIAGLYFGKTTELLEAEEYTIVGIYRQSVARENVDTNLYTVTPNTIYVPLSSLDSSILDYGYAANFRSVIMQAGMLDEFRADYAEAGWHGAFYCSDNGYSSVAGIMDTYSENAETAMIVGLAIYGVVLLIVLMLFPGSQRKAAIVMDSLGANRGARMLHILVSGLIIFIPASILGTALGTRLWQMVVDILTTDGGAALSIQMDVNTLGAISIMQLGAAVVLTLVLAVFLSASRGLGKRK